MNNELEELIQEGSKITFKENCYTSQYGTYSKASQSLLSWVSRVENYIRLNYDEESGPFKLFETFNRAKLNGYEKKDFEKHITILLGALNSCKKIAPNKTKNSEDNVIISLIKNYLFWTVLVVAVGASYKFGYDNGNVKFDVEKIELNKENDILKEQIKKKDVAIQNKDSLIIELKSKLKSY